MSAARGPTIEGALKAIRSAAGAAPVGRADLAARFTPPVLPCKPPPRPSTIERDPEVAAFLRQRFAAGDPPKRARKACLAAFGDERTPSVDRINRFLHKVLAGG